MSSSSKDSSSAPAQNPLKDSAIHQLLNRPLTEHDLQESTQRVAQPLIHAKVATQGHLLFSLNHELFLFPSQVIDRVTRVKSVRRIPHRSNQVVRGLCQLEGDLLICGDLSALMQMTNEENPEHDADSGRMVVLGSQDRWVVQVDQVIGVVSLDDQTSSEPPVTVRNAQRRFVDRLATIDGQLASVLDAHAIISAFQAALT